MTTTEQIQAEAERLAGPLVTDAALDAVAGCTRAGCSQIAVMPDSGQIVHHPANEDVIWDQPPARALPRGAVVVDLSGDVRGDLIRALAERTRRQARVRFERREHERTIAQRAARLLRADKRGEALELILDELGESPSVARRTVDLAYGRRGAIRQPSNEIPAGGWTVGQILVRAVADHRGVSEQEILDEVST